MNLGKKRQISKKKLGLGNKSSYCTLLYQKLLLKKNQCPLMNMLRNTYGFKNETSEEFDLKKLLDTGMLKLQ